MTNTDPRPTREISAARITRAEEAGRKAAQNGDTRAPVLSAAFGALLRSDKELRLGDGDALARAWLRGYDHELLRGYDHELLRAEEIEDYFAGY